MVLFFENCNVEISVDDILQTQPNLNVCEKKHKRARLFLIIIIIDNTDSNTGGFNSYH